MRRILIVEDHHVVREALATLLSGKPNVQVVGTAASIRDVPALLAALSPDIILSDLMLEDGSATEILRLVRRERLRCRVIILTGLRDVFTASEALAGGARGYVLKGQPTVDLLEAIETVAAGRQYVSPTIAAQLSEGSGAAGAPAGLALLTRRESEVLRMLAHGYTNREVAVGLSISIKTIETHRANMKRKLSVRNTVDLIRFAAAHGIGSAPLSRAPGDAGGPPARLRNLAPA